jgi:hypothetical protein
MRTVSFFTPELEGLKVTVKSLDAPAAIVKGRLVPPIEKSEATLMSPMVMDAVPVLLISKVLVVLAPVTATSPKLVPSVLLVVVAPLAIKPKVSVVSLLPITESSTSPVAFPAMSNCYSKSTAPMAVTVISPDLGPGLVDEKLTRNVALSPGLRMVPGSGS